MAGAPCSQCSRRNITQPRQIINPRSVGGGLKLLLTSQRPPDQSTNGACRYRSNRNLMDSQRQLDQRAIDQFLQLQHQRAATHVDAQENKSNIACLESKCRQLKEDKYGRQALRRLQK